MAGKVYWKDREVLKVNELYVEGYGWLPEDEYQRIMFHVDKNPATLANRITQRNIQYMLADGKTGQMDIDEQEFWKHRTFVALRKFYFTFGTSPSFPFYKGWVEVLATSRSEASEIFSSHYPPINGNTINCAFIYDEDEFAKTGMGDGPWGKCHCILDKMKEG